MIEKIIKWALCAAVVAAVGYSIVYGYETWRDAKVAEGDKAGAARVRHEWDEDRARAQAQALKDAQAAAQETQRRLKAQQENERAQSAQIALARADAQRARAAADGVRQRAGAYLDAAGCGSLSGDPAIECIRKAAATVADALGRSADIARRVAGDADEARARGLKCEADYDSLTAVKP